MRSIKLISGCRIKVNSATARVTLQGECVKNKILFVNPIIPPVDNWILATGFWNDNGVWDDTKFWID